MPCRSLVVLLLTVGLIWWTGAAGTSALSDCRACPALCRLPVAMLQSVQVSALCKRRLCLLADSEDGGLLSTRHSCHSCDGAWI
jgi:hypothetical protein